MSRTREQVAVILDAPEIAPRSTVATLSCERGAGKTVIAFAYEPGWLASPEAFAIDPALPLFEGDQYPANLPGILSDAAPDRWGRTLLERREALVARREDRRPRELDDWDYLLGVADATRMGALRFAQHEDGDFIDQGPLEVPPVTRLRELEHWAREAESGPPGDQSDEDRWVAMLVAPGSSLGGARPKASFVQTDGTLWIAKFPSTSDRYDVGAWECIVSRLAQEAGIEVPTTEPMKLGSEFHTFCSKRFDRSSRGRRLYASAMTLTGLSDNEDGSYLDIARAIVNYGDPENIEVDLEQLFRRVVFNVLTANRDDHLLNHGFLRTPGGWRLAPAFDVNPAPGKPEHALAIDDRIRVPDLDLVTETAQHYRLTAAAASAIVRDVLNVVNGWRTVAGQFDLPQHQLERMAGVIGSR